MAFVYRCISSRKFLVLLVPRKSREPSVLSPDTEVLQKVPGLREMFLWWKWASCDIWQFCIVWNNQCCPQQNLFPLFFFLHPVTSQYVTLTTPVKE